MRIALLLACVTLAGCGSAGRLAPAPGQALPVAPYGATATPTPEQLVEPAAQARPQRSFELLRKSDERKADPFDLPPPG